MDNLAVRATVAITSVRIQYVWDNRQRTMPVLFGSGKGFACPREVCAIWWNDPHPRSLARRLVCVLMANSCSTVSSTTGVRVVSSRPMWLRISKDPDSCNLRCKCRNKTWLGWRLFGKRSRYICAVARPISISVAVYVMHVSHFCVTKLIHPFLSMPTPEMIIFPTLSFSCNYRPVAVAVWIFGHKFLYKFCSSWYDRPAC